MSVVHDTTRQQLDSLIAEPTHAVLLVGPAGSGKAALAVSLAETVLELAAAGFADYPYKMLLSPEEGKAIGVEAVRQLQQFLSLRVPRANAYSRAVIVQNAETLTTEAQNALLKTLEEPPAGTLIILTASHEQALLPTIRSRSRLIAVKRPARAALEAHFRDQNFDNKAIQQAYAVSSGLPGLMQALLEQSDHPLLQATEQARQLLRGSAYDRLLLLDELSKQRPLALETTRILQQMAHVSLQTAAAATAERWQRILSAAYQATEDLSGNAQAKLVLTKLMLSL